jgi:hypothetical protein
VSTPRAGGRLAGPFALAAAATLAVAAAPPARAADASPGPFARGTAVVEIGALCYVESWDKNLATDRLAGGALAAGVTWREGWAALVELDIARAVHARSRDAGLVGLSGLVRWYGWHRGATAAFVEGGVGASTATAPVPPRGTRFNFLAHAGVGLSRSVRPGLALLVAGRWLHLSNGGLVAGDQRNPDLQAIGGYAALQWTVRGPRTGADGRRRAGTTSAAGRAAGSTRPETDLALVRECRAGSIASCPLFEKGSSGE